MRIGLVVCALSAGVVLSACGGARPSSLEFVDISPAEPNLGQITTVRFRAVDGRGKPMAGAQVAFALETENPGVALGPAEVWTNKGDGLASTQLTASGRVSSVVVKATSGDKVATSPPISFAGSVPNARQFTFQCGSVAGSASGGVHAIGAYDETRYLIAGVKVNCIAHVGDRNGDGVPKALVSFLTEAGTLGPSATSVSDVVGNASTLYKTSYPLPKATDPVQFSWNPPKDKIHTGQLVAPLWMHPFLWVSNPVTMYGQPPNLQEPRRQDPIRPNLVLNPRDNLVTMIAITTGEEAFDDLNNNGKYDIGEDFEDLTEPFVDSNDNGTWDSDERYVDTDGNGRWDGKSERYDASTLIWTSERLLWTGMPHAKDAQSTAEPVMKMIQPSAPPALAHYGYTNGLVLLADPWFNSMAQNAESDGCETDVSDDRPLVLVSGQSASGIRFTYPSPTVMSFTLRDAHDPFGDPPDAPYPAPAEFLVPIICTSTASPLEGHKVTIGIGTIVGTVL